MNLEPGILGMKLVVNKYVPDTSTVKRTWKERLFTLPWRPFSKYKNIYAPRAFLLDGTVYVSPKTADALIAELEKETK